MSFFKSFIPKRVSNELSLSFFELLRKMASHNFPNNLERNIASFKNHIPTIEKNNGYIEDQHNYSDMFYGNKTLSYCGCEIISAFNALYDLTGDKNINLPMMINDFEKDGIVLSGQFGTSPKAIENYFTKNGFKTLSSCHLKDYDEIGEKCDALILTLYNDRDNIFNMVHSINITKKDGQFYIHNNGGKYKSEVYKSITDILTRINGGKSKDIFLIGIFKK